MITPSMRCCCNPGHCRPDLRQGLHSLFDTRQSTKPPEKKASASDQKSEVILRETYRCKIGITISIELCQVLIQRSNLDGSVSNRVPSRICLINNGRIETVNLVSNDL